MTGWALDEHVRLSGPFHTGLAVGVATFDLVESGTGILLQFSFRALGVVDAAVAEALSRGWAELVGMRPKPGGAPGDAVARATQLSGSADAAGYGAINASVSGSMPASFAVRSALSW